MAGVTQEPRMPMWTLAAQLPRIVDRDAHADVRRELAKRRRHYELGWTASEGEQYGHDLTLAERAYVRRHGAEYWGDWMDGWVDSAAGREHGHLLACTQHHNGPGGCGAA